MPETLTPDGLKVHDLPNVGLVVSAAEHNRKMAKARNALRIALNNFSGADDSEIRDALAELGG